jgi:hypothetical protein
VNGPAMASGGPWRCKSCGGGLIPDAGEHDCPGARAERRRATTAEAVRHLESLGYAVTPPGDARS